MKDENKELLNDPSLYIQKDNKRGLANWDAPINPKYANDPEINGFCFIVDVRSATLQSKPILLRKSHVFTDTTISRCIRWGQKISNLHHPVKRLSRTKLKLTKKTATNICIIA